MNANGSVENACIEADWTAIITQFELVKFRARAIIVVIDKMLVADSLIGGCDICINAQTEMFSIAFRISYHFCFLLLTPTQLLHQTFLILPIRTITVSLLCMPISTLFQF